MNLVKRLRQEHSDAGAYNNMQEAADRIEALEAEKKELALEALSAQSQAFEHYERIKALEAALREAREALRTSKGHHIMIGGSGWKSAEMQCAVAIAKINEVLK